MHGTLEERARRLLDADGALTVPLSRLHRALVAEAGPSAGTYGQLRERLRRSDALFELIEPPSLPLDDPAWSDDVRETYRAALQRAGAIPEPRVVLRERPPEPVARGSAIDALLARVDRTVLDLWSALADHAEARDVVAEAMAQLDSLRAAARSHVAAAAGEVGAAGEAGMPAGDAARRGDRHHAGFDDRLEDRHAAGVEGRHQDRHPVGVDDGGA